MAKALNEMIRAFESIGQRRAQDNSESEHRQLRQPATHFGQHEKIAIFVYVS